ncbi:MAG: DUF1501 domain-containing protein [Thiotrichaceae bacterium]|nr:DUF1501 domain-containing protein [Thiotrichaceae bacterium]
MNRRDFLQYAGYVGLGATFPEVASAINLKQLGRIVVLVHLKGGNDGFNTLVPYEDGHYYDLRPNIAISKRAVHRLEGENKFGMHPHLSKLDRLWKSGEMAWVHGVGYSNSSLSHFQSLDVLESGSLSDFNNGWLSHIVPRFKKGLHGVVIDNGVEGGGVMNGRHLHGVTLNNLNTFVKAAKRVESVQMKRRGTSALTHITQTQNQLHTIGEQIAKKVGMNPRPVAGHYSGDLGNGLQAVAQMILNGVDAPVYKVTQPGFDTHSSQITAHGNALFQLASGLDSFSNAMKRAGVWDKVLVVTYSEFGRRAKENKGAGTDHGTASAQMVLGGSVKRGIYGQHPNLAKLDQNGNVRHTTDFRSMYGTIAQRWWHQPSPWGKQGQHPFV